MLKKYRLLFFVSVIFLVALMTLNTTFCEQRKAQVKEFYREIELFADAISFLNINYVDEVKPKELIHAALKGMLSSLDDYSFFLEPEGYKEVKEDTKGEFGGLGIEVGMREGLLTVISPIDGTPAAKAGLLPKDVIVRIDGEVTRDVSFRDAVRKLRGKPGTKVVLTIWRESNGEEGFKDITIERAVIEIESIKDAMLIGDSIGYIRLSEFREHSDKDLEKALDDIDGKNLKGIILDLRNNAGGLLSAAIKVSDIFIKKGDIIVSTKGRVEDQNKVYTAKRNTDYNDTTLVVLVNAGSASASEIVAGAVRDNGRGVLVGKRTFGKGSVQTVIPLKDGSALRVTTAKYFTPKGICIDKEGILPDSVVEEALKKESKDDKDIFDKLDDSDKRGEGAQAMLENDSQLKAAFDIAKVVNLYRRKNK